MTESCEPEGWRGPGRPSEAPGSHGRPEGHYWARLLRSSSAQRLPGFRLTLASCTPPRPFAIADGTSILEPRQGSPPHQVDASSTGGRAWLTGSAERSTLNRVPPGAICASGQLKWSLTLTMQDPDWFGMEARGESRQGGAPELHRTHLAIAPPGRLPRYRLRPGIQANAPLSHPKNGDARSAYDLHPLRAPGRVFTGRRQICGSNQGPGRPPRWRRPARPGLLPTSAASWHRTTIRSHYRSPGLLAHELGPPGTPLRGAPGSPSLDSHSSPGTR
jgi:hypothetical protein